MNFVNIVKGRMTFEAKMEALLQSLQHFQKAYFDKNEFYPANSSQPR